MPSAGQRQTGELPETRCQRDGEDFVRLYDEHVDRVFGHVRYRMNSKAEAEDITQEAFTRAWKAFGKYKKTGAPFVAWLIAIADNLIADYFRKKKPAVSLKEAPDMPHTTNLEKETELKLAGEALKKLVARLKGDRTKVIMMRFIDGFSYEEIARALRKSEGAIRVIQYRALCDLRKMMEADKS